MSDLQDHIRCVPDKVTGRKQHSTIKKGAVALSEGLILICSLPGRQAKKQKAYCPEGGILCLSTRLLQQRNCRLYI
jgi:hypothetical protein